MKTFAQGALGRIWPVIKGAGRGFYDLVVNLIRKSSLQCVSFLRRCASFLRWLASSLTKAAAAAAAFLADFSRTSYARTARWLTAFGRWSALAGRATFDWSAKVSKLVAGLLASYTTVAVKKTTALVKAGAFLVAAAAVVGAKRLRRWASLAGRWTKRYGALTWDLSVTILSILAILAVAAIRVATGASLRVLAASGRAVASTLAESGLAIAISLIRAAASGARDLSRGAASFIKTTLSLAATCTALTAKTLAAAARIAAELLVAALTATSRSIARAALHGSIDTARALGLLSATASAAASSLLTTASRAAWAAALYSASCLSEATWAASKSLLRSLYHGGLDTLQAVAFTLRLVKSTTTLTTQSLKATLEAAVLLTRTGARLTAEAAKQTALSLAKASAIGLSDVGRVTLGALTVAAAVATEYATYFAGEATLALRTVAEEATEFGRALYRLLSDVATSTLRATASLVVSTARGIAQSIVWTARGLTSTAFVLSLAAGWAARGLASAAYALTLAAGRAAKGLASALYALTLAAGRAAKATASALYALTLAAGRTAKTTASALYALTLATGRVSKEIGIGLYALASEIRRALRKGWTTESWKLAAEAALIVITTTATVHLYQEGNLDTLPYRGAPAPTLPEITLEIPIEETKKDEEAIKEPVKEIPEPAKEGVKEPAKVEKKKKPVIGKKIEKKIKKKLPDAVVEKPKAEKPKAKVKKKPKRKTTPDIASKRKLKRPDGLTYPYQEISRGPLDRKEISITFDGGSKATEAKLILEELRKRNIRTTIFLTGEFIEKFPRIVTQMVKDGHEIGNHMWDHPHLTNYSKNYRHKTLPGVTKGFLRSQLLSTERAFRKVTGMKMAPIWRAPYGEINKDIRRWAYAIGYVHVGWTADYKRRESLDTLDWVEDKKSRLYRTSAEIKKRVLNFGKETNGLRGGIILMHLGTNRHEDKAAAVLGEMMDDLMARGYRFVKVSDLMGRG